jgi:hypothetical protein
MRSPNALLEEALSALQLHHGATAERMSAPQKHASRRAEKAAFDPALEARHVARIALNRTPQDHTDDVDRAIEAVRAHAADRGWGVLELVSVWERVPDAFDYEHGVGIAEDVAHVQNVIDAVTALV